VALLKDDFSFQKEFLSKMEEQKEKIELMKFIKTKYFGAAAFIGDKYEFKTISLKEKDILRFYPLKSLKLISKQKGHFLDFVTFSLEDKPLYDKRTNIYGHIGNRYTINGEPFENKVFCHWKIEKEEMLEFQEQEKLKEQKELEQGKKYFDLISDLESLSNMLPTVLDEHEIKTYLVKYQDTFKNLDVSLKDILESSTPLSQKGKNTLSDLLKDFHSTMISRINEIEKEKQDFIKFDEEARQMNYKEIINFEKDFQLNNLL
jgi:hypothetical protein